MRPPEAEDDEPPAILIKPPSPLSPDPTDKEIEPPLPTRAPPEDIKIDPLLPELEVPDVNDTTPLTPEMPEFEDCRLRAPLDVADPYPVWREIFPPELEVELPEDTTTDPPDPLLPDPTIR
jgi:hypothetical protein